MRASRPPAPRRGGAGRGHRGATGEYDAVIEAAGSQSRPRPGGASGPGPGHSGDPGDVRRGRHARGRALVEGDHAPPRVHLRPPPRAPGVRRRGRRARSRARSPGRRHDAPFPARRRGDAFRVAADRSSGAIRSCWSPDRGGPARGGSGGDLGVRAGVVRVLVEQDVARSGAEAGRALVDRPRDADQLARERDVPDRHVGPVDRRLAPEPRGLVAFLDDRRGRAAARSDPARSGGCRCRTGPG